MTRVSFWISVPTRHIKFQLSLMEQFPLRLRLVPVFVSYSCWFCQFAPAAYTFQPAGAYFQRFILIFTQKQMMAFQWVKGRWYYGTMQHCCLFNTFNFSGGFCRHRLFSRLGTLCSRTEWDPLSCGHYTNDTDGFFHGRWYWQISNSYWGSGS